ARAGGAVDREARAGLACALAHDAHAQMARRAAGGIEAAAVVADSDADAPGRPAAHDDLDRASAGVLDRVVQRFLSDAIERDLDVGRQAGWAAAVEREGGVHPGGPDRGI